MKQVIKAKAKDDSGYKIAVTVTVERPNGTLTRYELECSKGAMFNRVFNMMRECGFMCHEIKLDSKTPTHKGGRTREKEDGK